MSNNFFCKICVYPSSKPHIEFNEDGIYSGCIAYQKRPKIDWKERELRFKEILNLNKKNTWRRRRRPREPFASSWVEVGR